MKQFYNNDGVRLFWNSKRFIDKQMQFQTINAFEPNIIIYN